MSLSVRILPEVLRSIDSSTFTGLYQSIGTPLEKPSCLIKFVNNSTSLITISWDGTNDNDVVPANSFSLYDITSNTKREDGLFISVGTQFYVKGAAGTGFCYLVSLYPTEI